MKLDKEQKKELRNLIVAYAKKLGYKARQNTFFRVNDAAMVFCDFFVFFSIFLYFFFFIFCFFFFFFFFLIIF